MEIVWKHLSFVVCFTWTGNNQEQNSWEIIAPRIGFQAEFRPNEVYGMDLHGPPPSPHPLFMSNPTVHCWQAWNLSLPMIIFNSLSLSRALTSPGDAYV